MAEAIGTALGVVGVLGQLFAGCVQAYGFFTTAANLDTDSQRLLCKVRIEEMRLVVWGRDWGVAEGRLEAHLESTRNPQLRSLALQILGELHSAVTDFNKLKESASSERSWGKELGLRAKWVIGARPHAALPPRDGCHGRLPQLTTSANLKKLRINLDTRPQASFKPTFALKVPRPALELTEEEKESNHRGRSKGRHETAGDVVIEWVDYDRDDVEERVAHVRRLDDLARMMHSASECHPDLHSIDCVGYVDDSSHCRYGLVYKAPSPSFSTLHELIASPDLKTPDLDDRVRLAHTLAVALWSLHSLDWLHKSLCSANILFFPSAFSTSAHSPTAAAALVPDIQRPYLTGFDASRPDFDQALSVAPRNPSIATLHRHPASLRGFPHCKPMDIYSLGLVLLEIGLWKILQAYHRPHYSADRWRDKVVRAVLVPGLGSKVGRRYRDVVEKCLSVSEEMTSTEAAKVLEEVVTALEGIRV
ncbi:hypothetical protein MRS44_000852 [Fusarium solani]|uniref:uncharacterized protein n=1 Tax=Fusarium solani TaxID=169388 RepID=UPI0032C477A0|nr:hypothetical protein MRS44_000852 [Fusarium solani]